jgi:hypothetical protein
MNTDKKIEEIIKNALNEDASIRVKRRAKIYCNAHFDRLVSTNATEARRLVREYAQRNL